ncbi:hypothetical protein CDAR_256421 [Caerostris darwini]|uniref:Uncharacterized protein n=1 Tax=Caerostris darwini TaxID=1538125 RepID=A0AAV4SIT5_9ARAC|nr:hypothetical protein CDAR_256421 [Caerostris darwini]
MHVPKIINHSSHALPGTCTPLPPFIRPGHVRKTYLGRRISHVLESQRHVTGDSSHRKTWCQLKQADVYPTRDPEDEDEEEQEMLGGQGWKMLMMCYPDRERERETEDGDQHIVFGGKARHLCVRLHEWRMARRLQHAIYQRRVVGMLEGWGWGGCFVFGVQSDRSLFV